GQGELDLALFGLEGGDDFRFGTFELGSLHLVGSGGQVEFVLLAVEVAWATAWSSAACACLSAASFSWSCCLALEGSNLTTGSSAFTRLPVAASQTIRRSGTLTGAVTCTERRAFSSPRLRTMTRKSPLRAGAE